MKLVLRGANKGKTAVFHGVAFSKGVGFVREDQETLKRVLRRFYQALPEHEPDPAYVDDDGNPLKTKKGGDRVGRSRADRSKGRTDGEKPTVQCDDGPSGEVAEEVSANNGLGTDAAADGPARVETDGDRHESMTEADVIRSAVMSLDPELDCHWTSDGQPALKIVAGKVGEPSLPRSKVVAAAPGITRESVLEQQTAS